MNLSDNGIALIKEFEGFRSEPYADVVGKMTIGYGHLIRPGETFTTLTEADATKLLCKDAERGEACIQAYVDVDLNQNQFDALCSFIFNLGTGAFQGSTLLRKINAKDKTAADEFLRWNKAGGKVVEGLTRRRKAERELYLKPENA